ncbi:hypothetical protein LCI18_011838 [Fusarium solani-melongenae]|uniref:Uncharacterized protein n=1 Tax=Fusarium solani subsp. cucurbitae TaxID=2747967 RepID=A0ACD3ZIJ2_FUSSC|nr:hypothetical protein LCI18_011838 [Fusarium solani-melongenae]
MKFVWSLALLAAAGASAQSSETVAETAAAPSASSECEAEYIVKRCLETENAKAEDCKADDWDCLCAAYEAIVTCYNNCPDDTRASSAQSQVQIYCQQASLYGTRTKTTKTATAETESTGTADATATGADASEESASSTSSSSSPDSTNNAADLARNTGGVLLAVAGVVAAML